MIMLKRASEVLTSPVFPGNEDKTRKARYANVIAFAFLLAAIVFEVMVRLFANYAKLSLFDFGLFLVAAICVISLAFLRRGQVRLTSILLVVMVWLATNGLAATGFGTRDSSFILNFAIVLMAGLLLGWQASFIITALSILSGFVLAYAEQSGYIQVAPYTASAFARDITFVFGLNGVLIYLLISGLEGVLKKSRKHLLELETSNITLNDTQNELQARTAELMVANKQLENRTRRLQAIAMMSRTVASIQNFDLLLNSITNTICNLFGYYHVGIFLLDEHGEFAILRAVNTEGGQTLINRGYRVPVGSAGPVGFVSQTGQPQVTPAAIEDPVVTGEHCLPETRSEIVLPLKSGEQIIGVLDIQSVTENAFMEEDTTILSILADQVAITIQNSSLYEQSQRALRKADISSNQSGTQAWMEYERTIQTRGYRYDGIKSEPLRDVEEMNTDNKSLSIPIQLRGQTIGRFKLNPSNSSRGWTDDELVMVRATAERVALALEGTRLLDEAQKRAMREAFLSDVATKLSASFRLDSILRDTVQELGQALKNATITFQLVNPAEETPDYNSKRGNGNA
jgi:GAF domain-containing protein